MLHCLSRHTLFEVWGGVLRARLKDDHLSDSDAELLQVWGHVFWEGENVCQLQAVTTMRQSFETAARALTAPLLQARDHRAWQSSTRHILDCLFKLWAISRAAREVTNIGNDVNELLAEILQAVELEGLDGEEVGARRELTRFIVEELHARPSAT